ncbi:non-histone protein [Coemansia biformis]|uniref:Non-histone protein n=1 Tax=Coemansia biformis TaxID=1286918 RepID=A0A9W7Y7F3_9FUNG|nr:non-histone protein [Coemansia biformis]
MSKGLKPRVAGAGDGSDEKQHKYRCRELRRQLDELEEYNDVLAVKLQRSQKRLRRMKIERNILLERFEHTHKYGKGDDDSASDSDAPLKDTFPRSIASDIDGGDAGYPVSSATASVPGAAARGRRRQGVGVAAGPHTNHNSSSASTPRPTSAVAVDAAGVDQAGATPTAGTRRLRVEKDPNAPKRPANAFVLYCQVERPNIKSAGTELTSSELTKAMGVKWKGLSKDEKQQYYDLYEREMDRYHREMVTYKGAAAPAADPTQLADTADVELQDTIASSPALAPMDVDSNPADDADVDNDGDADTQPPTAVSEPVAVGGPAADSVSAKIGGSGNYNGNVASNNDVSQNHDQEQPSGDITPSTAIEREEPGGMHSPAAPEVVME